MTRVELIYDTDCPNVRPARKALLEGFSQVGLDPSWTEWERKSGESPAYVLGYGSPTILVDGRDVAGASPGSDNPASCRLYRSDSGGFGGAPSVEQIAQALRVDHQPPLVTSRSPSRWRNSLAPVPGIAFALLPKLACPACWPAYAGLVSSVGLGFLLDTAQLVPLTVAFLVLSVSALAFRARTRRGFGPSGVGLIAASLTLLGKFVVDSNAVMYVGIGFLIAASAWNGWPRRTNQSDECGDCVGQVPAVDPRNAQ